VQREFDVWLQRPSSNRRVEDDEEMMRRCRADGADGWAADRDKSRVDNENKKGEEVYFYQRTGIQIEKAEG
jgi:hypothetical protein